MWTARIGASLNTAFVSIMYFLVIDDRACQILNRSKYGQNGLPWWSTVGLPIADKADYFSLEPQALDPLVAGINIRLPVCPRRLIIC
jgi:hypothetical protein